MNEINKAINDLKGFIKADTGQGDLHMSSVETALSALREKQKREKGCKYCTGKIGECEKHVAINTPNGWVAEEDIKHCFNCGRRLTKEEKA